MPPTLLETVDLSHASHDISRAGFVGRATA